MKLITRAQLGWPASAAPTQSTTRGVKVHYEGSPVSRTLLMDHSACIAEWKNIRASHLAHPTENYSDVAYNYAACPHGCLLEGRGLRRRTGANGTAALNQAHYAIVGLVGSSGLVEPTDAMLHAIRDGIDLLRQNGAGTEIKGHRDGHPTACPGEPLYAWVQKGAPRPNDTTPVQEEDDMAAVDVWAYKNKDIETRDTYEILRSTSRTVARLETAVTAQTAAIQSLAAQLGEDVDTAAVVAAVQQAIADAVIRVDVDVNGQDAP